MNALISPLQSFWQQRNRRERQVLTAGGVLLLLLLIHTLLLAPLWQETQRLSRSLPALRADVARFSRDLATVKGQAPKASLASDMATLALAAGLPASASKIDGGPKHSTLHASAVAWPAVTALLAAAQAQGWSLSKLSVRGNESGNSVDADLEWTR